MNNKIIFVSLVAGWFLSIGISGFLAYENINLRSTQTNDHVGKTELVELMYKINKANSSKRSSEWQLFDLEDINYFRNQGKVDGKVEAMLLMSNNSGQMSEEQIAKIIELAEKKSAETLSADNKFLSLLCQAAYHKGIASGQEASKEEIEKEYENGYHKAIDDFTCPETGKMSVPEKQKFDMTKPSK